MLNASLKKQPISACHMRFHELSFFINSYPTKDPRKTVS